MGMPHQSLLMLHQSQFISLSLATNPLPSKLTMHQPLLKPLLTSHQADQHMPLLHQHLISSMPDTLQFIFTNNHQYWNRSMSHSLLLKDKSINHLHQPGLLTSQLSQPNQYISHSLPNLAMNPCLSQSPSIKNHLSKHTTPLHRSQHTNLLQSLHLHLLTMLHLSHLTMPHLSHHTMPHQSHHTMLQLKNLLMDPLQSHRNPNISQHHRSLSTSLSHKNPNTNHNHRPNPLTNQDPVNLLTSLNHPSSNINRDLNNTSLLLGSNNTSNHPSQTQSIFQPQVSTTSLQSSSTKVSDLQSMFMKNLNQSLSISRRVINKSFPMNGFQKDSSKASH